MKLSQMPTKQAAACMAELVLPVQNIITGKNIKEWFEKNKEETVSIELFLSLAPVLLTEHYDDAAKIAAVLSGKTKEQIDSQTFSETMKDLKDCIDSELIHFFI